MINKVSVKAVVLVTVLLLTGCFDTAANQEDIRDYFPLSEGMVYNFGGEGNEYAPFSRKVMYVEGDYGQIHDATAGTTVVGVYLVTENKVELKYNAGEFYETTNVLDKGKNTEPVRILIQSPLTEGNTWETEGQVRTIIEVNDQVEVPAGIFADVIKVEVQYTNDNPAVTYEYYAKDVGLILREYVGETFKISSFLESYGLEEDWKYR